MINTGTDEVVQRYVKALHSLGLEQNKSSKIKEDLELIRIVISKILQRPILMDNILQLYNNEPKLFEINKHIDLLEGYNKSLNYDKEFLKNKGANYEKKD